MSPAPAARKFKGAGAEAGSGAGAGHQHLQPDRSQWIYMSVCLIVIYLFACLLNGDSGIFFSWTYLCSRLISPNFLGQDLDQSELVSFSGLHSEIVDTSTGGRKVNSRAFQNLLMILNGSKLDPDLVGNNLTKLVLDRF